MNNVLGENFHVREYSAIHKFGKSYDPSEKVSLIQACDDVASGIIVEEVAPVIYSEVAGTNIAWGDKVILTHNNRDDRGNAPKIVNHKAVIDGWKLRQYDEYAALLNDLSSGHPVTVAGVVKDCSFMWFCLDFGSHTAKGPGGHTEALNTQLVGMISQRPGLAHRFFISDFRKTCSNMLFAGWNKAIMRQTINHKANVEDAFRFCSFMIEHAVAEQRKLEEVWELFMNTKLTKRMKSYEHIIEKALPMDTMPRRLQQAELLTDKQLARLTEGDRNVIEKARVRMEANREFVIEQRDAVRYLVDKFNDEHPQVANTSWAMWNAITEYSQHRSQQGREKTIESLLGGERFKVTTRAYNALVEHTN